MDVEDDDLSAMRSALLASMPSKPSEKANEEEDLSALRLAALMTRRQNQNQIQVIQQRPTALPPPQPSVPPFPGNFHRMMPPPSVPHNLISLTGTQNLISLTPGPEPNAIAAINPPIVPIVIPTIRPQMQRFAGVGRPIQPFQRHMRPHNMRSMRPNMMSMHPHNLRSIRPLMGPIRHNQGMSIRTIRPVTVTPRVTTPSVTVAPVAEAKVSDKFSRYNSDSSSDEDDLHTSDKKKTTSDNDEESDAESVASEKSFSSVSEKAEIEVENINDAEDQASNNQDEPEEKDTDSEQDNGNVSERNESDDNISIIDDEEDDILAAIDDYLENRPEKPKPKMEEKAEPVKPVEKKTHVEKIEKVSTTNPAKTIKRRKSSSTSSKASVVDKLPIKVQQQQSTAKTSQTAVKKPTKSSASDRVKVQSTPKPQIKAHVSGKVTPGGKLLTNVENFKVSGKRDQLPPRHPQAKQPFEEGVVYEVPVIVKQVVPSPIRQRRDSDLDSVGTSDLSFISSESEDEVVVKKPAQRPRTRSTSGDFNREDVQNKPGKKRNMQQAVKVKEKTPAALSARSKHQTQAPQQPTKTFSNPDLRKKLEKRGLKKEIKVDAVVQKPMEKIKSSESLRTLTPVTKTGVISLKRKSRVETEKEERPKSRSSSIESSPRISLPEPEETRRIIITRPNTSATSGRKSSEVPQQLKTSKNRTKLVSNPKKLTHVVKTTVDSKPVKRKDNKDKSVKVIAKTHEPQRKKSNILPPKSEKRLKISEEKTLYKKVVPKDREQPSSSDGKSSTSEESDSSVSEEFDPDLLEEVFAFNEADIPEFDDVLGKIDDGSDHGEGEYIYKERKSTKNSQTKSKKRKRTEVSQSRKMIPDSRRIVPKTDSALSNSDREEKSATVRKPTKKSVHQRLGIARRENIVESQPVRERIGKKDLSHYSDSENSSEESLQTARGRDNRSSVVSSTVRSQPKHRVLPDDANNETLKRNDTEKEKRDAKRRKRKILVSGKDTKPSTAQSKVTKRETSVKERLGKVVLSSVSVRNRDGEAENAEESRYEPRRKDIVVKRRKENYEKKTKNRSNPDNKYLEARIKRIQQQNGAILRRQKEIEMEKERYGF